MGKSKSAAKAMGLPKLLCIIAGILIIVQAVLSILNPSWAGIIGAIISQLVGIVVLMQAGLIPNKLGIPYDKIWVLIMGIIAIVLASWWGGVILIIAAVLLFMANNSKTSFSFFFLRLLIINAKNFYTSLFIMKLCPKKKNPKDKESIRACPLPTT